MTARRFGVAAGIAFVAAMLLLWPAMVSAQGAAGIGTATAAEAVLYVQGFTPPPEYARWYKAMEKCTGLAGNFAKVEWYVTPRPWIDGKHKDLPTYGMWRDSHKIVLHRAGVMDSTLVSHEMVHDLLGTYGLQANASHPRPWFGSQPGACAPEFWP